MDQNDQSKDLLGIASYGRAVEHATEATFDGLGAFLGRICLPVAEEFGLLMKDHVGTWRARNANRVAAKAQEILDSADAGDLKAPPRLVMSALELGSWTDDEHLQSLWAGLLSTSCSEDGRDEANLIFIDLLSKMTVAEVRILDFVCDRAEKETTEIGLIYAKGSLISDSEELLQIAGLRNIHDLDRDLDHMRSLQLIANGFTGTGGEADVTPSPLALNLYSRCRGWSGPAPEFYGVSQPHGDADNTAQHDDATDRPNR